MGKERTGLKAWIVDDPIEAVSAAVVFAETRVRRKCLHNPRTLAGTWLLPTYEQ